MSDARMLHSDVGRMIYVIQSECGRIKIGSSISPQQRAEMICASSPLMARLIAKWPGRRRDELELHKRLDAARHHNEWFLPKPEVLAFVSEVYGRGLARIVEWDEIGWASKPDRERKARYRQSESMKRAWADPAKKAEWLRALQTGQERSGRRISLPPVVVAENERDAVVLRRVQSGETLKSIGKAMGVSRQRVHQIVRRYAAGGQP